MLNHIAIQGRLTAAPELKTTTEGTSYCRFSIAVDRPRKNENGEKIADFFNCIVWRKTAEIVSNWFGKGDWITIIGSLRNQMWVKDDEKRTSTQILVKEVHFSGGSKTNSREEKSEFPTTPPELEGINDFDLDEFEEILSGEDVPF